MREIDLVCRGEQQPPLRAGKPNLNKGRTGRVLGNKNNTPDPLKH